MGYGLRGVRRGEAEGPTFKDLEANKDIGLFFLSKMRSFWKLLSRRVV